MTVVGNPYGDQSGAAPDWQAQKDAAQGAWDRALQQYQSQREGMLQQYGFTSTGGLNDILSGKDVSVSFNPQYQNSIMGNALQQHGNTLQKLREQSIMRNIGDYGVGAQNETSYQRQAAAENESIKQRLFSDLAGNIQQAKTGQIDLGTTLRGITDQQGKYQGWADSHYASEGGNVKDPLDTEIIGNDITKRLGGINFKDSISAGAGLGRVRDSLKNYLEYAGTDGFDSVQLKNYATQYRAALVRAGLNPKDARWLTGNAELDKLINPPPVTRDQPTDRTSGSGTAGGGNNHKHNKHRGPGGGR